MNNKKNILEIDSYEVNHIVDAEKNCQKYIKSYREKKFTEHAFADSIIRGDYCNTLITIIFNSNNIEKSRLSVKQYIEKAKHSESIQICIKIDNDDPSFVKIFLKCFEDYKCNFIILASPKGRGYIDLWNWVNYLYKVSSKRSYFVINTSDEMYVNEDCWDIKLSKYKNFQKDNIFRLRTSVYKNRNYNNLWECGYAPDTTAIYTKKYLDIQGNFSPCFGPDNGQQFVAYYLSNLNYPRHYQFTRDIAINEISFKGQGTNAEMKGISLRKRQVINYLLWDNMFKHNYQEDYLRRARKIQVAIILDNTDKSHELKISEDKYNKKFEVFLKEESDQRIRLDLGYKINKLRYILQNRLKIDFFKHHTASSNKSIVGFAVHFLMKYMKIHPETILYKEKYNAYILYKIILLEEHKIKEFSLKNLIFILIVILGSTYFYICNKFKVLSYSKNPRKSSFLKNMKRIVDRKIEYLGMSNIINYSRNPNDFLFTGLLVSYMNINFRPKKFILARNKLYHFYRDIYFFDFLFFCLVLPYNLLILVINSIFFIFNLYSEPTAKKYIKSDVVVLTDPASADQSKVLIIKGD